MPKLLHIADVHLDTTFLCRNEEIRVLLRGALRRAFERAVDCAIEESVDAVLVAGDLFDSDRLSFATERFLIDQVARLEAEDIPFIYVTGNHDPGSRTRAGSIAWPANVRIVSDPNPVTVTIPGLETDIHIVCAGHNTAREGENLAARFPPADGTGLHVGLLHTMVTSAADADAHDRYAPSTVEDLDRPGYACWTLGHIHLRQEVGADTPAFYSGNIQGRNPRETGAKGGLLLTLDGTGAVQSDFRAFAPVQWVHLALGDLSEVDSLDKLEQAVDRAFSQNTEDAAGVEEWLVRVTLTGSCPLAHQLADNDQIKELEEALQSALAASDVEIRVRHLTSPVDLAEHTGQPHLLGEVLALLEELTQDPSRLDALPLAQLSDERTGDERREYLLELIQDLDRESADRLLK